MAAKVWATIIDGLAARFDAPRALIASDVGTVLQDLADKGVVRKERGEVGSFRCPCTAGCEEKRKAKRQLCLIRSSSLTQVKFDRKREGINSLFSLCHLHAVMILLPRPTGSCASLH